VPPVAWWLLVLAFGLTLAGATLFYLGPWWALFMLVVGAGVPAAFFAAWSIRVGVAADGFRAGRARVEWRYVADVEALDRAETQRRLRTEADPAAFLVIRPYLRRAVLVRLADPSDSHPYWLVSARHPDRLARAARAFVRSPGDDGADTHNADPVRHRSE